MGKHIDWGDVVSGCSFTAEAPTEAALLETMTAHVHPIRKADGTGRQDR